MYSAITDKDINTIVTECQANGTNIQQLKELLASALVEKLTKIQANMSQLSD
jgi:tryptophanyl-tRNA synthetase